MLIAVKEQFKIEFIGSAVLVHADALGYMREMLSPAYDGPQPNLIVCDPPYKLTSGGNSTKSPLRMRGKFSQEYTNNGEIVPCDVDWKDFMGPCAEILRRFNPRGAHAYFMANNRHIANCENAALEAGFEFHNWLVWDKISATPNRWYMKNCEFTGLFYTGRARYITDCGSKQLIRMEAPQETEHPTEKPVALMEHYIGNSSKPGDVVFDPFMGSGTTGVAAIRTGRLFIGIEKDAKFFELAVRRLRDARDNFQMRML